MRISRVCLAVALLACFSGAVWAQQLDRPTVKPDPQKGLTLAQRWCASCHLVSREQSRGSDTAPSFQSIARQKNFNAERLAFFLLDPHPMMPNMTLSRNETRDIAAYIGTLRR